MAHNATDTAALSPGLLSALRPERAAVPVIVAAIGTLLLTTAEAQPLLPRLAHQASVQAQSQYLFSYVIPMGGTWKSVIITLLVVVSVLAVFRGWRDIKAPAAVVAVVIGAAALLASLLVLNPALSVLDLMTSRVDWASYLPVFILPFFSGIAALWLSGTRDKRYNRFASGILLATGAFGYLAYLQRLDTYVNDRAYFAFPGGPSHGPSPGRALFIGILGAGVVLVAGVLARADNVGAGSTGQATRTGRGGVRLAKLASVAAVIAIVIASFFQFSSLTGSSAPPNGPLSLISIFILGVAGPVLLAVAGCLTVAGRRDPDRHFAAGVLITGFVLTLAYNTTSHVFGWLEPLHLFGWLIPLGPDGAAIDGADIGAGAALAMAVAAIALLSSREAPTAGLGQVAAESGMREARAEPEMTRYLCTAPHLDDRYARRVIEDVVADPHRAVVPSLGIDMGTVVRQCFAARRRQNIRDGLITVSLIAIIPVIFGYRGLADYRDILIFLVLAGLVAFTDRWYSRYVVTRRLTRERFNPEDAPWLTAAEQAQLAEVLAAEQGDINVYGTYNPFVGSGFHRDGWSFAINIARGKETPGGQVRLEPLSFEVDEFYQAVERDIMALGLAGLSVENRLLVDGQNIRDDRRFLPSVDGRPVTGIGADKLLGLAREPELQNRPYQCIRLQAWEGDLVLSIFVNFTKRGTALLAEVQHYLLAPLQPDYRQADRLASWSLGQRLRTELKSAPVAVIGTMIRAPFRLGRLLVRTGLVWRKERTAMRRIKADPEYNFGAVTSVRELAQSRRYRRYFQQVDRDLNTKLFDRQVLDTIVDFLDSHNIDISQFEEQRAMILNNGLLISGGEFKAGSVAIGEQSRAGVTQISQGVQTLLRPGGESK
jgi:hypothetical protein